MDSHALKGAKPETLKKLLKEPKDEFGVKHLNLISVRMKIRCTVYLKLQTKSLSKNIIVN